MISMSKTYTPELTPEVLERLQGYAKSSATTSPT